MKRKQLTEAFRTAANEAGFGFNTGPAYLMNSEIRVYPAVWMEPPVLKSIVGRSEGDEIYRATLHFMTIPSAGECRETIWDELQADALGAVAAAANMNDVREISGIVCTPREKSLTAHGELSVTLECDARMWFRI